MNRIIITLLMLLLSLSTSNAQVIADTLNTIPNAAQSKYSIAFGCEVITQIGGESIVGIGPNFGIGVKTGIGYTWNSFQLNCLMELAWIKENEIDIYYGIILPRYYDVKFLFPHITLSLDLEHIDPFVLLGYGLNLASDDSIRDAMDKNNSKIGFGGGTKFKSLAIGINYYKYKISKHEKYELNVGLLFNIRL